MSRQIANKNKKKNKNKIPAKEKKSYIYDSFLMGEINTIASLVDHLKKLEDAEWWFRGLPNANHSLLTSMGRYLKTKHNSTAFNKKEAEIENQLIEDYQAKASSYIFKNLTDIYSKESAHDDEDIWFWLFIMQHYGVPTRLLDWTMSPLIALWFSIFRWRDIDDDIENDTIIYFLNPVKLLELAGKDSSIKFPPFLYTRNKMIKPTIEDFRPAKAAGGDIEFSLPIVGLYNNDRIKAQKGRFTVSKNPLYSLQEEVLQLVKNNKSIIKETDVLRAYLIKRESIKELRKELSLIGLTHVDILPELEGVSKTMIKK